MSNNRKNKPPAKDVAAIDDAKKARSDMYRKNHKKNHLNKTGKPPDKVKKMSDKTKYDPDVAIKHSNRVAKYITKNKNRPNR